MKLHIYAQAHWHQDAFVIGDREGLELLRDACEIALKREPSNCAFEAMTSDGEGYAVLVARLDNEQTWEQLMLPYTDPITDPRSGTPPWEALGEGRYVELHKKLRARDDGPG